MKKLLINLVFLLIVFPALSQVIYINGTVTDIDGGFPIPDHAVTIMSDSANGIFYFNVVYTDSSGFYFDEVPVLLDSTGILIVQTFDCEEYLHQAVIYLNPGNNTYTQDFQICSMVAGCQAQFTYFPFPQGSPDAFQFTDLSAGNIILWYWDFGDGTYSEEQNPYHIYPGPGTFNACLTITGFECTSTSCQEIVISDTVYQQLYGQVFAGNFPLREGMVQLFALNPNGVYTPLGDGFPLDSNGVYYFSLVPEGTYLIQAIPHDSTGYLPTYYGDVINWQQATQVVLGEPANPYNINLVPAGQMTPGPGSISGQINNIVLRSTIMDKIIMLLMNESLEAIGFTTVSSSGYFYFPSLDYGIYHLRAELSGVSSENMKIEISPEDPHRDIILNFTGNGILDIDEKNAGGVSMAVYPNPVTNRLNIAFNLKLQAAMNIEIFSITGQLVYHSLEYSDAGENAVAIPFGHFPAGIYTLRVYSADGINLVRKVVKPQ